MFRFLAGIVVGAVGLALTAYVAHEMDQTIKVGDMIQWEINGSYQFPKPVKVERIEKAEDMAYLFVDGTKTGIPVNQAIKVSE